MPAQTLLVIIFIFIILGFLIVDLGYLNRQAHKISTASALWQTIFWIAISLIFGGLVYAWTGGKAASEFMAAYVTEKMLSVDNLFVIMLLFSFFKIDEKYHHRVLFWGILGAVVFRGVFITIGSVIIEQFHAVLYVFGVILLYTGIRLFNDKKEEHIDFRHNKVFRIAKRFLRFTDTPHEGKFLLKEKGQWHLTILFMVLLLIETTDIIFAVDSIPAAFAISQDPLIVFTSNIFAVMGLRALFFLVEHILHRFHHLQKGLSFILIFIGLKMLIGLFEIHISSMVSLLVVLGALGLSMVLSVLFPKKI